MSEATVHFLLSRLAIASVEFFLVGLLVALLLAVFRGVPPAWRRRIWFVALCKPFVTVLTGFTAGFIPVGPLVTGCFLGDAMFPIPGDNGPLGAGATSSGLVHLLIYVWLIVTAALLVRVWLRILASQQLIEESLEKGYMLKPTTIRRLDPDVTLPPTARVIVTPEDAGPATLGVFNPAIVIPESLLPWVIQHRDPTAQERARFRQVLRHELAHITNRDDLLTLATMVLLSFFWFHPIAHWAYRRVRMNNELCCDETVLASGIRPAEYVDTLMNIVAGEFRRRGFAMSILGDSTPAGVLRRRLHYLLSEYPKSRRRPILAYATLALLVISMPRFLSEGQLIEVQLTTGETRRIALEALPYYPDVERVLTQNVEGLYDYAPLHVLLASGVPLETLPGDATTPANTGADASTTVMLVEATVPADQPSVNPADPADGEMLANVTDEKAETEAEEEPAKKRRPQGYRGETATVGEHEPILPPPSPGSR